MAVALALTAAKHIVPADRALRQGDWRSRYEGGNSILLRGKTALVLGYGAIGRRIAAACLGLGMKVIAIKRRPSSEFDGGIEVYAADSLRELLPKADVLFLSLPLTPETTGLIGAAELGLLPHGAVAVNVGRGPVFEESALYQALRAGKIRAGLDVWYNYPAAVEARSNTPPSRFPFHQLDNVVMSPHCGGHSDETENLRAQGLTQMLNAAAAGKPLPNPVDVQKGY
jgi:phosphoglycerate dehydrogenase-like enzyme